MEYRGVAESQLIEQVGLPRTLSYDGIPNNSLWRWLWDGGGEVGKRARRCVPLTVSKTASNKILVHGFKGFSAFFVVLSGFCTHVKVKSAYVVRGWQRGYALNWGNRWVRDGD